MTNEITFTGANWLGPEGMRDDALAIGAGKISKDKSRRVDLSGKLILPGIIDLHGDGFERHLAPRRGAMKDLTAGILSTEAELAANGITTAVLAQFYSWEGGLRSPEFATRVLDAIEAARPVVQTDLKVQLRLETHMLDAHARALEMISRYGITYVAFNDHLPHKYLAAGKRPPRLIGTALKSGRNPEKHLAMMHALHDQSDKVPAALDSLCKTLAEKNTFLASHDESSAQDRATWAGRGVTISEFPETIDAAEAALARGNPTILGAPNVVRGASHNGNVSARDLIAGGFCTALASDYHYPAPRNAIWDLVDEGITDFASAWRLVSTNPAKILNLTDRGTLEPGKRADLTILDADTRRCEATLSGGAFTHLTGDTAARLLDPEGACP